MPLLIWLLLTCAAIASGSTYHYHIKTFNVPLDHFSFSNNKTFDIRYLINDTYATNHLTSPVLFYTGNEGDIEMFAENTGFLWEIAPQLRAVVIFAEHRYYGKSLPFGNASFDTPQHLGYLTSEQALADYADLLDHLYPDTPAKSSTRRRPIIAMGGSYGGMLAAWFRIKYPHIVTGAIAASAPILQFGNLTPCSVFSQIVTSVFATAYHDKTGCVFNVKQSWSVLKKLSDTPEGRTVINQKLRLCPNSNLTKPEDQQKLADYLTDVYGNLAMVNYPYSTNFLAPLPAFPVMEFCSRFSDKITNDTLLIDALQSALSVYTNYTGKTKCLDTTSAYDSSMGDAQWNFQSCTEMVMPMCSGIDPNRLDMFPMASWNFTKYSDECFGKFGVRPRSNAAITTYGGYELAGASNIVFSNGLLDPWSGGGVLRTTNDRVQIVIIPDGAHHLDLRATNKNDPESVISARKLELAAIRQWINY